MQNLAGQFALWILFYLGMCLSQAGTAVPSGHNIFDSQLSCKWRDGSLSSDDLAVMGFTIGSSSLKDVQKQFPATKPIRLIEKEEAEIGICLKNAEGDAVVFATGVYGAPADTLTRIYLAPARLVESRRVACAQINVPSSALSTTSGIRTGATVSEVQKVVHAKIPHEGPFCVAYEIASDRGPLRISKNPKSAELSDSTGVSGSARGGKIEWLSIFGIASN